MLTISSCVFSTVDIGAAVITQKYFISVNYVGIGRFTLALGKEMSNSLKSRNLKQIKKYMKKLNIIHSQKLIVEFLRGWKKLCMKISLV